MGGAFETTVEKVEGVTSDHYPTHVETRISLPTPHKTYHPIAARNATAYRWVRNASKWREAPQPLAKTAKAMTTLLDAVTAQTLKDPPGESIRQATADSAQLVLDTIMCIAGWKNYLCEKKAMNRKIRRKRVGERNGWTKMSG